MEKIEDKQKELEIYSITDVYLKDNILYSKKTNEAITGKLMNWGEYGQMETEEDYQNGLLHGKIIKWDKNGQIRFEGNYQNGQKHGKLTKWSENGQIEIEENYKNGQELEK